MASERRCVFDGGELEPRYGSERFTTHTPIGSRLASWLAAWVCKTCGLMYDASVMPDPRIEAARKAEEEDAARRAEALANDPKWQEMVRDIRAARLTSPATLPASTDGPTTGGAQ